MDTNCECARCEYILNRNFQINISKCSVCNFSPFFGFNFIPNIAFFFEIIFFSRFALQSIFFPSPTLAISLTHMYKHICTNNLSGFLLYFFRCRFCFFFLLSLSHSHRWTKVIIHKNGHFKWVIKYSCRYAYRVCNVYT